MCLRSRQAVEYVWFLLAIVACLGLIFAALTNCQVGLPTAAGSLCVELHTHAH